MASKRAASSSEQDPECSGSLKKLKDLHNDIRQKRPYRHAPLANASREVRLFCFPKQSTTDDIKIFLYDMALEDCPIYAAMSYLWGGASQREVIEVNEKIFDITRNAYISLQQVFKQLQRGALEATWFWMDSICINQTDINEKARQVQLMGDIYEQASETLACIGAHQDDSELVLEIFQKISQETVDFAAYYPTENDLKYGLLQDIDSALQERFGFLDAREIVRQLHAKPHFDITQPESAYEVLRLSNAISQFKEALMRFANRPYWYRIWIVQEIRLAKHVKILCGSSSFDIRRMAMFCSIGPYASSQLSKLWLDAFRTSRMYAILSNSRHTILWASKKARLADDSRWLATNAFETLCANECTDFRDRVYGLLRIIRWHKTDGIPRLVPDYEITKVGLMIQVAKDYVSTGPSTKDLGNPFARYDSSGLNKTEGWQPGAVLTTLYQALKLSPSDPEMAAMIMARQCAPQVPNFAKKLSTLQRLSRSSAETKIEWEAGYFLLQYSATGSTLRITGRNVKAIGETFENLRVSPHLQHMRLDVDDGPIGYVCPQAQAGDHLVIDPFTADEPVRIHLIVRQIPWCANGIFEMIGFAFLYGRPSGELSRKMLALRFEITDFIALIGLRMDALREGLSVNDALRFLGSAVTRQDSSSYATVATL